MRSVRHRYGGVDCLTVLDPVRLDAVSDPVGSRHTVADPSIGPAVGPHLRAPQRIESLTSPRRLVFSLHAAATGPHRLRTPLPRAPGARAGARTLVRHQ